MRRRRDTMLRLLLNLLLVIPLLKLASAGGHGGHKHVVIHVPYKVKTIHHTHTITKHIHHGGGDKYEVLGYTVGHPIDLGSHGGGLEGHDFGGGGGGGGHDFSGGGDGGGHDFGGGGGSHLDFGGGDHLDFGGGGGGGFGGGSHDHWSGR
ncbi:glycine-rich cell wall structural protein 1.8 [Harpegnathos saltator]|uniref:Uncharacterized protein n=1 Tax=Harpegnathos saltator TaxID=610380 RepID=E2BTP7_HARSA|nr:glycine-rich cell wall structural protein 1.8 [Harpegnathos saltator]EFN80932.1 hypothetical protein EAI_12929 [Harpegnathos saltator]